MIRYNIIATGSKGNAVKIDDILIDCGVSFKKLKDVYKHIRLVLLTHEHSDHFRPSTIRKLAAERPTLRFGCCRWMVPKLIECGVSPTQIDVYDIGKRYDYKVFALSPIKLYHDVPNKSISAIDDANAVSFTSTIVSFAIGGMTVLIICGTITHRIVCIPVSPSAFDASYCPLLTPIIPPRNISAKYAA